VVSLHAGKPSNRLGLTVPGAVNTGNGRSCILVKLGLIVAESKRSFPLLLLVFLLVLRVLVLVNLVFVLVNLVLVLFLLLLLLLLLRVLVLVNLVFCSFFVFFCFCSC